MAPETALKRLSDDGYNAHLQAHLTRLIALIGDARSASLSMPRTWRSSKRMPPNCMPFHADCSTI